MRKSSAKIKTKSLVHSQQLRTFANIDRTIRQFGREINAQFLLGTKDTGFHHNTYIYYLNSKQGKHRIYNRCQEGINLTKYIILTFRSMLNDNLFYW